MRLTLAVWGLALLLVAFQGCLVRPEHNLSVTHTALSVTQVADDHALHASGCLQHCEATASAINPASQHPMLDLVSWAILWLPALLLNPSDLSRFAFLALRRPVPSAPPARLLFVRFND
ncbi:hypothetical protein [Pseudomonas sp. N040]|uniref:hypothetical protein n=1 Tax=Pseudomonas sp. N040 TaxID=2785325 RepID=UPI001E2A091E|nr:hypothetical protein [Pseudomonas sp. N040]